MPYLFLMRSKKYFYNCRYYNTNIATNKIILNLFIKLILLYLKCNNQYYARTGYNKWRVHSHICPLEFLL